MTRSLRSRPNPAILCSAVMLALSMPAAAQEDAANDPRLVTQTFDESRVFTIKGRVKVQTTIKFAPDEAIQNVAIGDSNAWQVQPNQAQSILFVKPLEPSARTNMTVVTNRRTYLFDLVASPRNAPLYVLQFRYPELEKAEAERVLAEAEEARNATGEASSVELAAANDPYAVADPASLNFDWASTGERELLPERIYDNGRAVFLTWPGDASIPSILITNEDGDEGPANWAQRGDTLVLDHVPSRIVLRSGDEVATLTNNAPAPARNAGAPASAARGS
ncbi:MAG: TrbG/VirB9 family P-type conjugative transfer protein [Erythrobacter sp.]|uniref:TrbG/VirB9 family P-type conjugative transfer protein n=1 Tax=Erythrobacter sp. TaxID=1042 RepID=UPI003C71F0BF